MIGWLRTLSTGGGGGKGSGSGSGGGSGGSKCFVTDGGVVHPNRGNTGRTPVTCLRAAILPSLTWRDSPDRRGVDKLTEELEGNNSQGDKKR